jgi:hypothetical protein
MPEYDAIPDATGAQWAEDLHEADRRVEAELQARADARLTDEEVKIVVYCLSIFILQTGNDLRGGGMSPTVEVGRRHDIATARSASRKLRGEP